MKLTTNFTDNMKRYSKELENLGSRETMEDLGIVVANCIKPIIPTDTGAMANSYDTVVRKRSVVVQWKKTADVPYTRYQYFGKVMTPNIAVFEDGVHTGEWYSRAPKKLAKDNRDIGIPRTVHLKDGRVIHIKGYTMRGADHNPQARWAEAAVTNPDIRATINIRSGRYVYEAWCKALGENPVGGYAILGTKYASR